MLSSEKNLYEILGVTPDAALYTIKSAYRKLVRKYHPDLNNGDRECARKFKAINEAYEILSNPEKKKHYDTLNGIYREDTSEVKRKQASQAYRTTQNAERKTSPHAAPHSDTNYDSKKETSTPNKKEEAFDFSDVLNDFLRGFRSTTSSKRQNFREKQQKPINGTDVNTEISITLHEAVNGTSRTINVLHTEACPNCEGRRFINGAQCPVCKGSGERTVHKRLLVKIPGDIKQGSKIRIANEGNRGYYGGQNGDLYLNVKIESDSILKFSGLNVLCTIPITPAEAVLGANITIPSADGKIKMKILPNTNSGQKFRLSSQGLSGQNGEKGDMIVTVNIEIPKNLTEKERKLYEELKKTASSDIRENL